MIICKITPYRPKHKSPPLIFRKTICYKLNALTLFVKEKTKQNKTKQNKNKNKKQKHYRFSKLEFNVTVHFILSKYRTRFPALKLRIQ